MARMLAPINSIKHYVQRDQASIAAAARDSILIVDATAQNAVTAVNDVVEGSIVKAIFLEYWLHSEAAAGSEPKFQLVVEKVPAGQSAITFAQMNNLMSYPNKKNILFFSQGILGDQTTQSVPVVRQWFKIPKGKQRFGLGDQFVVSISATSFTMVVCGFATYKEYK